jgi:hypothetical protein
MQNKYSYDDYDPGYEEVIKPFDFPSEGEKLNTLVNITLFVFITAVILFGH